MSIGDYHRDIGKLESMAADLGKTLPAIETSTKEFTMAIMAGQREFDGHRGHSTLGAQSGTGTHWLRSSWNRVLLPD